jgi:hypothetical protein
MQTTVHMVPGARYAAGIQLPIVLSLLTTAPDGSIDLGRTSAPPDWADIVAYKAGHAPAGVVPPAVAGADYDAVVIGTWTGPEQDLVVNDSMQIGGEDLGVAWVAPVSVPSSPTSPTTPTTPSTTEPACEWWNVPCWPTWAKVLGAVVVVGGVAGVAYGASHE